MAWGTYGILIVFGAFILLLIFSPNLSCFGKRVKSPLYPFFRKKKKKIKAEDYGFHLVDVGAGQEVREKKNELKAGISSFSRVNEYGKKDLGVKRKKMKTRDYGLSLVDDSSKQKDQREEENTK